MKIFIIGAAGFIGSKLAKSLIIGGNEILGYDNFHSQVHGLDSGLIQSVSQALLPLLSAWVEVGGIASSLCPTALLLQPIST